MNEIPEVDFAEMVIVLRRCVGVSQVAEETGISVRAINELARARRMNPHWGNGRKLFNYAMRELPLTERANFLTYN